MGQFGGGTEKAPALSLVTHCQALDAQGESQANEFISQGFNLLCTEGMGMKMSLHQSMCIRCMMHAGCVSTPGKKIPSLQGEV